MGVCLEVIFVQNWCLDKNTVREFASLYLDKDLWYLYDHGIFDLDKSGEETRLSVRNVDEPIEKNGYGDKMRVIPAKKLLDFIEAKKEFLLKTEEAMCSTGNYNFIPYFESRVQCLISMLKTLNGNIILYWS